jgi:two-component system alkaline phosphatase synthesis response regulator PhoP
MIFCVEDDPNICELVVYTLKTGGFEAKGFAEAESFFKALEKEAPSLILLDIMLPVTDGLTILRRLKASGSTRDIPVIMLTAKDSELDKVQGLDLGADDYVAKPFGVLELISRVKSVLRRTQPRQDADELKIGSIALYFEKHRVLAGNEEIRLTLKEFELLHTLMLNSGIVLSRERLLEKVWGYEFEGETRTVDVHVRTLRQKLGPAGEIIQTIRGVGYRIGEAP